MKHLLVTGFTPFHNEAINPSEIIANELAKKFSFVDAAILPVSYEKAFEVLQSAWNKKTYDGLLMFGQAGGRKQICLERVAHNWVENIHLDEDGVALPLGPILSQAPEAYISDFFPHAWVDELSNIAPTIVSFSAGTFVCNNTYFKAIHNLGQKKIPTLFVHVPYLPEQTKDKLDSPFLGLQAQLACSIELVKLWSALGKGPHS